MHSFIFFFSEETINSFRTYSPSISSNFIHPETLFLKKIHFCCLYFTGAFILFRSTFTAIYNCVLLYTILNSPLCVLPFWYTLCCLAKTLKFSSLHNSMFHRRCHLHIIGPWNLFCTENSTCLRLLHADTSGKHSYETILHFGSSFS